MANIAKQWSEEIVLPDGKTASSMGDVDRYLRENSLALSSDYSQEYREKVRYLRREKERKSLWADFIANYKRSIWNER